MTAAVRVALVTTDWVDFIEGGVATLCHALASGLDERGLEVEVWTRGGGRRERAIAGRRMSSGAHPYQVRAVPGRSWRRRGGAHWRRALPVLLREFQPAGLVLSSWELLAACEDSVAQAGGLPAPVLGVMAHGREITALMDDKRSKARESAIQRVPRWFVLSDWLGAELRGRGVAAERIVRVPAAVLAPGVCRADSGGLSQTLMTLGRLIPRKGQDRVIEALALLAPSHPELRYLIVGRGPDEQRLRALARRLRVTERVHFVGFAPKPDLEALWQQADLLVMPARTERGGDTEGYGLCFLEAGARGLPVLAGRSAGVVSAVQSGENGVLIDDPDDPAQLATALAELLSAPQRLRELGAGGRARFLRCGQPVHLARGVCEALQLGAI